jgi:hypothetical protein
MPFADDGNGIIERRGTHFGEKARPQHFGNEFIASSGDGLFRLGRLVTGPSADMNPTTPRQRPLPPKVLSGRFYSSLCPTAFPLAPSKADYDRQFGIIGLADAIRFQEQLVAAAAAPDAATRSLARYHLA